MPTSIASMQLTRPIASRSNNVTTGTFAISNSNVSDAVDKINAISGSPMLSAQATMTTRYRLYSADGRDISVENESTGTA